MESKSKHLVIILAETRASELTFENIRQHVVEPLHADLCVCIGVKEDYDKSNPFFELAKYRFLYPEPSDYAEAFDFAYQSILSEKSTSDRLRALCNETEHLPWRKFLEIKDQFMGGIKDKENEHPGSAGILIFYRWFLLQKILEHDLHNLYDRFIITRSDYHWLLPHPNVEHQLNQDLIWIPNGEHYRGVTDRHVVLSKKHLVSYLNILECMVLRSHSYFHKMQNHHSWNLEETIRFHLEQHGILDKCAFFPYVMFTIRPMGGSTRWTFGKFSKEMNCYIKYQTEYQLANHNKAKHQWYLFFGINTNVFYAVEIMCASIQCCIRRYIRYFLDK